MSVELTVLIERFLDGGAPVDGLGRVEHARRGNLRRRPGRRVDAVGDRIDRGHVLRKIRIGHQFREVLFVENRSDRNRHFRDDHFYRFHHGLRRYTGVIGARHPERVVSLHPPPPDQHVLKGVVEGVAHVQRAGHVRWRNDDRAALRSFSDGAPKRILQKNWRSRITRSVIPSLTPLSAAARAVNSVMLTIQHA